MVRPANVSSLVGDMDMTVLAYNRGYDITFVKDLIIDNNALVEARYLTRQRVKFSGKDLFRAYELGHTDLAKIMLEGNAPVNGHKWQVPLHWVIANDNLEGFNHLIAHGADVNLPDGHGQTALHFAAQKDNADFVSILLRLGANKNVADIDGRIPKSYAGPACARLLR